MKHRFPGKKLIGLLLAISLLLSFVPTQLIPVVTAITQIPAVEPGRTVIVAGKGASYTAGDVAVVQSLTAALSYLTQNDPSADGVIIIAGTVTQSASIVTQYAHTGTIYITGASSDHGVSGGMIYFTRAGNTNNDFGGPTFFENLKLQIVSSSGMYFRLFANSSMIFGDDVTISDTSNRLRLLGGSYFSAVDSYIELNSGTVRYIYPSNIRYATGTCRIVIDAAAKVSSFISTGGWDAVNDKGVDNVIITVNGGVLNAIYSTPNAAGLKTDSVTVNFNGGTCTKGIIPFTGSTGAGKVTGDFIVNMSADFTLGDLFALKIPSLSSGESTLNLIDLNGTLDSRIDFTQFDNININSGDLTYKGVTLTDQNINVAEGASLKTPNVTVQPAGVNVGGEVTFGSSNSSQLAAVTSNSVQNYTTADADSDVVYVSGSGKDSNSGTSASAPVKTLEKAYSLIDKTAGGFIVFVGDVTVSNDTTFYDSSFTGEVILTSVDPRNGKTYSGNLIFSGAKMHFTFSVNTRLENLNLVANEKIYLHSGKNMYIDQSVTTSGSGSLTMYVGFAGKNCKNVTLQVYGGSWSQILLGGYEGDINGNVTCTVGKKTTVTGSVTFGSGAANNGNITYNQTGGYVKVLYDTPRSNGTVSGTTTMNLFGGSINTMADYDLTAAASMGNIVVNVRTGFSVASATFGDWSNTNLTVGKRTLNYLSYTGASVPSIKRYYAVNLFGTENIPSDFTQPSFSNSSRVLSIYDYEGTVGANLSGIKKVFVTTSTEQADYPDVILPGAVSTSVAISSDNTDLYIMPCQNIGKTKSDYNIVLDDRIVFENPEYNDFEVIAQIDFENGIRDTSGKNNAIAVFGELDTAGTVDSHTYMNYLDVSDPSASYINSLIDCGLVADYGYNGDTALYIANAFGQDAKNYFTLDLTGSGSDIRTESYTVGFWYMSQLGGNDQWARSSHVVKAGEAHKVYNNIMGGVILSNQNVYTPDTGADHTGATLYQFPRSKFIGSGAASVNGRRMETDGIWQGCDDRWHYVTVSCDRNGSYSVYVDGKLIKATGISGYSNESWGVNALTFGADALGQYGLGNAYIDDIVVYRGAMDAFDVQANYYEQRVSYLADEIEDRVNELGAEYVPYKTAMITSLRNAAAAKANLTAADYAVLNELYLDLRSAYESFLAAPEKNANSTVFLLSDIHIGDDGTEENFRLVTSQLVSLGIDVDTVISAGDFSDQPSDACTNTAYELYKSMMTKTYGLNDAFFANCFGNHDIYYSKETANYLTAAPLYKEHMDDIIKAVASNATELEWMMDSKYSKTDEGYKPYSYAATYEGVHYIVLNTDYMKQTGNAAYETNADGSYSITGNKVDPIRHTTYVCDNTFAWMQKKLDAWKAKGDNAPIFVISHYMFENTQAMSFDSEIIIESNTVGRNDAQLRELLAAYNNVFYFCGHTHAALGMIDPYEVKVTTNKYGYLEDGQTGSFWQINLPSLKANKQGYRTMPAVWIMYVYDQEVVMRARDFSTEIWLTQYDVVIKLYTGEHEPVRFAATAATCGKDGNTEYYYCDHCQTYYADEACINAIPVNSWIIPAHGLTHAERTEPTFNADGNIGYWMCETCEKYFADAAGDQEITLADTVIPARSNVSYTTTSNGSVYALSKFHDDQIRLIDGAKNTPNPNSPAYSAWNASQVDVLLDLGVGQSVETFCVYAAYGFWGVTAPESISVQVSEDGVTYHELSAETTVTEVGDGLIKLSLSSDAVFAKYVMISVRGSGDFIWIDEVDLA